MLTGILALAAVVAAQGAASVPGPDPQPVEQKEAAYAALSRGDINAAIAQLENRLLESPDDPVLLINLGSAYAQAGKAERASAAYRAAIDSPQRYRIELADGKWVDSRRAARMAMENLENRAAFATR